MQATHAATGAARIGPNAIIQTVGALEEAWGRAETRAFLERVGRGDLAERLPATMVDEQEFVALIGALRAEAGVAEAGRILARSGERTAGYLLAHRIPRPAHLALPLLPPAMGLRVLLKAIAAHAWTFAGTGRFSYAVGRGEAALRLADCPECRGIAAAEPICRYYEQCFQTLLQTLIDRRVRVRETACVASGAEACTFTVTWR